MLFDSFPIIDHSWEDYFAFFSVAVFMVLITRLRTLTKVKNEPVYDKNLDGENVGQNIYQEIRQIL